MYVDSSLPVNDSIAVVEPVSVGGPERIVTTGGVVSAGGDGGGGGVVGGGVGDGAPPPAPPPDAVREQLEVVDVAGGCVPGEIGGRRADGLGVQVRHRAWRGRRGRRVRTR